MKILVADPSFESIEAIKHSPHEKEHTFLYVEDGEKCMHEIGVFNPDMLVLDLFLPKVHAIEILNHLKERDLDVGVIVTSFQGGLQNYSAAIKHGANYYLPKPFDAEKLFELIGMYEQGKLSPDTYTPEVHEQNPSKCYKVTPTTHDAFLHFWGTRGSSPVAGPSYVKYGGNTSCLEVKYHDDLIVIDAGTGIRPLGEKLVREGRKKINLFIGHTHWDHITGLPFFAPLYQKGCDITIWSPVGFDKDTKTLFSDMLAYAYFPVRLEEMHANIEFKELRDGVKHQIGELCLEAHYTHHPGPSFGFKITSPHHTVGYITDNEFLYDYHGDPREVDPRYLLPHAGLVNFLKGCDTLIHEAQYLPEEYQSKVGWGHSSVSNTTHLVKLINPHDWVSTHHDPLHTDAMLEEKHQIHLDILHSCGLDTHFQLAYDGLTLPL